MNIGDVLQRDPAKVPLANKGQARITTDRNDDSLAELRAELSTFVCEGQYAEGILKILNSYLGNLGKSSQRAAWVSGFYGSGKSHLLKMLCHLWQNTKFSDGVTAREIVPSLPDDLRAVFTELDTQGKRTGGVIAAAGSLPSGVADRVRLTVLGIALRAVGLPEQYSQARFSLWLHDQGVLEKVKSNVAAVGKKFDQELNNLYVSPVLARAVITNVPGFAASEPNALQQFKAQFPPQNSDISTHDFLETARRALISVGRNGQMPCTLLVLDEAQQFIGDSIDRSVQLTEVIEAISKEFESRVMVVAAGQSALTDVPLLQKMMDRFTIRTPLSDADVETVTRKVILLKKPTAQVAVRSVLDKHAGEISRHLRGTRLGEVPEDRSIIVDDYPLLPSRRRFWESCFRQVDVEGTRSQLRSQLRIIHDAVEKISDHPLGALVPGDELYDALAPDLVNTGMLLREINERIIKIGQTDGRLARRVCSLVFLIGKLPKEGTVDTGVRANKDHIADLLVEDLNTDNGKLRSDVDATLKRLVDQGVLLAVGDEYRLQTREGAEWDREFRNRQTKLANDAAAVQFKRDQLLYAEFDRVQKTVRILQGAAKEPRPFLAHRGQDAPPLDGAGIPVWVRDGWSASEKDVTSAARTAGAESPVAFVYMPRQSPEDLQRLVVEVDAAQQTLDSNPDPSTDEGKEARRGTELRRSRATTELDRLVREIISATRVFQGGGSELLNSSLEERLKAAGDSAVIRMFPRFKEADSSASVWEAVVKRARDGSDQPFQPTGHSDATERHAVCLQVIATIGSGETGTNVRKILRAAPYGWPQDAVDAALIALHRMQHLRATLNGAPLLPGQLDQNKVARAEFRTEYTPLSAGDRLVIRGAYQALGVAYKGGEEGASAGEFLQTLTELRRSTGGEPPLPVAPTTSEIEDVQRLSGNDQLVAIKDRANDWRKKIGEWKVRRDLAAQRLPAWQIVDRLARQAAGVPSASPLLEQVEAIRSERLLLQANDPVGPLRVALGGVLRDELLQAHTARAEAHKQAMAALEKSDAWQRISEGDRVNIAGANALSSLQAPQVANDDALASYLESHPLSAIRNEADAVSPRAQRALHEAARLLEPRVQPVALEKTTLRTEADVDAWLNRQRTKLLEALKTGPVLLN